MDVVGLGLARADTKRKVFRAALADRRRTSLLRGVPVATESAWLDGGLSGTTWMSTNTRKRHVVVAQSSDVRLVYVNAYNYETALPPNSITVTAAVEYAGVSYPVFFSGKRAVTIEPGGVVVSDPREFPLPAVGQGFWTRTWVNITTGQQYPQPLYTLNQGVQFEGNDATNGTDQPDKTLLTGNIGAGGVKGYWPVAVIGTTTADDVPVIGGLGDSVMSGLGDATTADAGYGYLRRALNAKYPYVMVSASGQQLVDSNTGVYGAPKARAIRGSLLSGCSDIVSNLTINDLARSPSQTTASIQNALLSLATTYASRGARFWQCTIGPTTSSTDTWATTTNQTPRALGEANRVAINDWLRAGAPLDPATKAAVAVGTSGALLSGKPGHPFAGYFDTADVVETARNSGIWKVGLVYTTDGLGVHPNPAGHAAMAAAIDVTKFAV